MALSGSLPQINLGVQAVGSSSDAPEDPPCRGDEARIKFVEAQSPNVGEVWKFGERGTTSQVLTSSVDTRPVVNRSFVALNVTLLNTHSEQ
ncbi:hypothetical protein TNCV_678821 [Trichonephila clavipes]|nr:hypothetical protein TNCV_678821 [Trichonephila clavipes]